MPNYIPFISYVLITTFTPGPNNIMSMLNAGRSGFKKGVKFNFGIFIGFIVVMVVCGAFSSILIQYLPAIKPALKYIGAAYILWLAYKTYKSEYSINEDEKQRVYGLKEGFLLQFVNPKVILYGITTLSTFIIPYYTNRVQVLSFSIGLAMVAFIATCCWALFGFVFHKFLKTKTKAVNTVMSLILVYTAISLFL